MKLKKGIHRDRGGLASPVAGTRGTVFSGIAARVHAAGDPLTYPQADGPDRREYRDAAELQRISDQLPGKPVRLNHSNLAIGHVLSATVEDGLCLVKYEINAPNSRELVRAHGEISLGYQIDHLDQDGFQRGVTVEELSLVPRARCGPVCQTQQDARCDEQLAAAKLRADLAQLWQADSCKCTGEVACKCKPTNGDESGDEDCCDPDDDPDCDPEDECDDDQKDGAAERKAQTDLAARMASAWRNR